MNSKSNPISTRKNFQIELLNKDRSQISQQKSKVNCDLICSCINFIEPALKFIYFCTYLSKFCATYVCIFLFFFLLALLSKQVGYYFVGLTDSVQLGFITYFLVK